MSRTQYYTGSSLDGFIATPTHSLDWLMSRDQDQHGPMNYAEFFAGVGAIAMGATTYNWVLDHIFEGGEPTEGKWEYDVPCWVFTHRELRTIPGADLRFVRDDVVGVHEEMVAASGGKNVWLVGGGDLVGQFADAGLLDEVIVMLAPVTLGAGAPLLPRRVELALEEVARNGDFTCARYSVVPGRAGES
jgi:dihydrofolate reductase